jgi:hypothetical protein
MSITRRKEPIHAAGVTGSCGAIWLGDIVRNGSRGRLRAAVQHIHSRELAGYGLVGAVAAVAGAYLHYFS